MSVPARDSSRRAPYPPKNEASRSPTRSVIPLYDRSNEATALLSRHPHNRRASPCTSASAEPSLCTAVWAMRSASMGAPAASARAASRSSGRTGVPVKSMVAMAGTGREQIKGPHNTYQFANTAV